MDSKNFSICIICHGKTKLLCKVGKYEIYKCGRCGLGRTKNSTIQRSEYHRDNIYVDANEQFKNIFQRRIDFIQSLNPEVEKVLEIGSSTGVMLSLLKEEGWEVWGVEISPEAANSAIKKGINTLTTPIEDLKLHQHSFGLIIINHTLEHLENPPEVIKKVSSLLKVGGILLVDVPNFGGLSARVFKKRWFALLPEEHLWHFTYDSLSYLLNNNGLEIVKRNSPSGIWDYWNPGAEIWMSFWGLKKRFFINVLTVLPNFIVTVLNQGSTLTVLARKT